MRISLRLVDLNNYLNIASSKKQSDPRDFLKARFVIFRCQNMWKYVKKRVHGKGGTTLPWALKKCTRSLYFTLLIKYFEYGGKNMSFLIKNDEVLEIYEQIWDLIKSKLSIKFHCLAVYDKNT